jgi:hypothetical protein
VDLGHNSDTKLQHFATMCGGWKANSVTVFGIQGNVNVWMISKADFLQ